MFSDLRFAFRQLTKAPGFSATIIITLALGIGACTAIFTAVDSILLRPFDDPAMARNVRLRSIRLPQKTESDLSLPDFIDLEQQAKSFEFVSAGYYAFLNLTGGVTEPLRIGAFRVTAHHFDVMSIKMTIGRRFAPDEFIFGNDKVVVLRHGFWQRAFGGTAEVIGRVIQINGEPHTVIGVAADHRNSGGSEVLLPLPTGADRPRMPARSTRTAGVQARLRPGATLEQVRAELDVISSRLAEKYPDTNKGFGIVAIPVIDSLGRGLAPMLRLLFGAVACVLLIGCANVANLLFARATARQREMSVRAALGASRGRLLRQLLTESILFALLGGAVGILLVQWGLDFIRGAIPTGGANTVNTGLGQLVHLKLNPVVLAFAVGLSGATALLFGLMPALLASRVDLNEALKQGSRGSTEGRSRGRLRGFLVVIEVALALVLLTSAGLLIRSFLKLANVDPGFAVKGGAFVTVSLRNDRYQKSPEMSAFMEAVLAKLQALPRVESAAIASWVPLAAPHSPSTTFTIDGAAPTTLAEQPRASQVFASPDYFRTMGIRLQRGRLFTSQDNLQSPRVTLINETLARHYFPNENPLGKRITWGNTTDTSREIIGVVSDVAMTEIGESPPAQVYAPLLQNPFMRLVAFVARTTGSTAQLAASIKAQVYAVDPDQPIGKCDTFDNMLHLRLSSQRLTFQLLLALAATALVIAAIGIYGVMAYNVSQRTTEIGIRMALGAETTDVLRLVMVRGAWLVGGGLVAGLATSLAAGRAIESMLFNTSARDPLTLIAITLLLASVGALACWLPARRATKVDPMVALRTE